MDVVHEDIGIASIQVGDGASLYIAIGKVVGRDLDAVGAVAGCTGGVTLNRAWLTPDREALREIVRSSSETGRWVSTRKSDEGNNGGDNTLCEVSHCVPMIRG